MEVLNLVYQINGPGLETTKTSKKHGMTSKNALKMKYKLYLTCAHVSKQNKFLLTKSCFISVLTDIRKVDFNLDFFWSDLDVDTVQQFINKHCVLCGHYFTSNHPLSVFRHFPTSILTGLDHTKMESDF